MMVLLLLLLVLRLKCILSRSGADVVTSAHPVVECLYMRSAVLVLKWARELWIWFRMVLLRFSVVVSMLRGSDAAVAGKVYDGAGYDD